SVEIFRRQFLRLILRQERRHDVDTTSRREFTYDPAELRPVRAGLTPDKKQMSRNGLAVMGKRRGMKSDVGDRMLSAAVGTAGDFHSHGTSQFAVLAQWAVMESFREGAAQTLSRCDPQSARVRSRAGGHIRDGLRPRLRQRQLFERKIDIEKLLRTHPRQV